MLAGKDQNVLKISCGLNQSILEVDPWPDTQWKAQRSQTVCSEKHRALEVQVPRNAERMQQSNRSSASAGAADMGVGSRVRRRKCRSRRRRRREKAARSYKIISPGGL